MPKEAGVPLPDHSRPDEAELTMLFVLVLIAVLLLLYNGAATGIAGRIASQVTDQTIPVVPPM